MRSIHSLCFRAQRLSADANASHIDVLLLNATTLLFLLLFIERSCSDEGFFFSLSRSLHLILADVNVVSLHFVRSAHVASCRNSFHEILNTHTRRK